MSTPGCVEKRVKGLLFRASLWLALLLGPLSLLAQEPETGTATIATIGPVSADQTLWSIARDARSDRSVSIHQFMLALVARNPDAFAAGNVNMLREGSVLEIPTADEARAVSAAEASRRVTEQMQWYAELSPGEVQALHQITDEQVPVADEPPAAANETAGESVSELETIPLSGPEPAPLESAAEETPVDRPEPDRIDDEQSEAVAKTDEPALDSDNPAVEPAELDQAEAEIVEDAANEDPVELGKPVDDIETAAEALTPELPAEAIPDATEPVADEAMDESLARSTSMESAPDEVRSEPVVAEPMAAESKSDRGAFWPVWVVLGVFGVAALMVWFMARNVAAQWSTPIEEGSGSGTSRVASSPEAVSAPEAERSEAGAPTSEADAVPVAAASVDPRDEESLDSEPARPESVDPGPDGSTEIDIEPDESGPADSEPSRKTVPEDSPWAGFEASVLSSESAEAEAESVAESKPESQSTSESSDELASEFEDEPQADFDSDFDSDFETGPEPEPEDETASTPEEAPGLSDADAEVMIDLARLTAQGGDRAYAVQLLDEVISDASPELVGLARGLKESLLNR